MTVREFIKKVQKSGFDLDKELTIETRAGCSNGFVDVYTDNNEIVLTQFAEEQQEEEGEAIPDFTLETADEFFANLSEYVDALKINGVR